MPPAFSISLNRLAAALLGADAYIYFCQLAGGYWKAVGYVLTNRIERDSPDPYAAIAAVAQVLIEYGELLATETQARRATQAAPLPAEDEPEPGPAYLERYQPAPAPPLCWQCAGSGLDYAAADCCFSCGGSCLAKAGLTTPTAYP